MERRRRQIATDFARMCVLAGFYYATARLGLLYTNYHDAASLVWAPPGLSLAALLLFGIRLWPGVTVGCLLLNVRPDSLEPFAALGVATGNTLEAVVGAVVLTRWIDFRPTLGRVRDVMAFLVVGVLGCTMVSATVGVASLVLSDALGSSEPGVVWLIWWLGDAGGTIAVAPLVLVVFAGSPPWSSLVHRAEYWLALGFTVASGILVFGGLTSGPWVSLAAFTPFPLVVWAGARLGPRGVVTVLLCIILPAVLGTADGEGPFAVEDPQVSTMLLWAYAGSMSAAALILASVIGQRDRADARYRLGEAERLRGERERLLLLERERITREMHDGVGGQLVSVISMLERGRASASEAVEALRGALDDMRILIDSVDPETRDLTVSLGKLRARLEPRVRRSGVSLRWDSAPAGEFQGLDPGVALHVLRIIQEAVTNALRHANARKIEVRIFCDRAPAGWGKIAIRDDGVGWREAEKLAGRGVRNMEARAAALDARLRLVSDGSGTRVNLTLPLDREHP